MQCDSIPKYEMKIGRGFEVKIFKYQLFLTRTVRSYQCRHTILLENIMLGLKVLILYLSNSDNKYTTFIHFYFPLMYFFIGKKHEGLSAMLDITSYAQNDLFGKYNL